MLRSFITGVAALVGLFSAAKAQNIIESRPYPQHFFRYPLDLPPSTAGTFGELRPNHFHSGLDFKTNHTTGFPVHAAYDGFISRLRVEFGGFGNAVYIDHPNGFTTVYGHLERFSPEIEKLVRQMQYKQQSFEVDFKLQPGQIPVCKGDVIAWSGNAGASEGPHLHFEIRDTKTEETINPQLFGLTIPDKIPPSIYKLGIYQLDGKPFSEKTPHLFLPVTGRNGHYRLLHPKVLTLSGQVGFGITANDVTSAAPNHDGIYSVMLRLDGKAVYTFAVERFAFDQTHAINAYIDYPWFLKTRQRIQKCFISPGSKITLYPQSVNRGMINFDDDSLHHVEFIVKDVAGNTSTLDLDVRSKPAAASPPYQPEGTLFAWNKVNTYSSNRLKVSIPAGDLYDDMDFSTAVLPGKPGAYSPVYRIGDRLVPINDTYQLWIKPDSTIGKYAAKAVVVSTTGTCENTSWQDGWVTADVRTFGDYYVKVDTLPPFIIPINIRSGVHLQKAKGIYLRIGDRLSGVKSYNGYIDGKWVLMEWSYKTHILSYTFDGIAPGPHHFGLTVTDSKDNTANFSADFVR